MTPEQKTTLARRLIACGLPVPTFTSLIPTRGIWVPGHRGYDHATRIMWQVVATDTGPELLPVLTDFALLGWVIAEVERLIGGPIDMYSSPADDYDEDGGNYDEVYRGGTVLKIGTGRSRIKALTVAWEAALEAAKVAG